MCENRGSKIHRTASYKHLSSDYIILGIQSNDKSFNKIGNNTFDCTILIGHANLQHKYIQAGHTDTIHCTRL